ncbi:MAG: hypothetical protein WBM32_03355, partial [Crocosphaera sp.]
MLDAGKEVRIVPNTSLPPYRQLCGWDFKDDEHDAVALAYYGWLNRNNLTAFNSIRHPEIYSIYQQFLEHNRINQELTPLINRARNLLHTEFPEAKNSKTESSDKIDGIWLFLAGKNLSQRQQTFWKNRLNKSIGSATKFGFSLEIMRLAKTICDLKQRRNEIKKDFEEVLSNSKYKFYNEAFDKFSLGIYDRIIFLCQIFPFEQFLDENGSELRTIKPKKISPSGKPNTKRVGLNRFHARLGKAVKPWSSGKKKSHIVTGTNLVRVQLYLWVKRNMVMTKHKSLKPRIKELRDRYHNDLGLNPNQLPGQQSAKMEKRSLKQWAKARV